MLIKDSIPLQATIIILVTALVYFPSLKNGFTNWDDPELILENTHIQSLSSNHMVKFFTASYGGFGGYTPLVFVSYALEYHFFKLNPRVFHTTNLLLHLINCLFVYWFMSIITHRRWLGFLSAVFFGIHPLHTEAVAWIQGRKDLLFSMFYLAALISFAKFLQEIRKSHFYVLSLFLFVGSLFSKVAAVSFPVVILLLEFCTFRKLKKSSLLRSLPFFGLSFAFLFLAIITDVSGINKAASEHVGYLHNLGVFFYSFVFYIGKLILPIGLAARYSVYIAQYPWQMFANLAIFTLMCALAYLVYRHKPASVTFGVPFFILTLMPTIPFHFFGLPFANRYTYLPIAGLLLIFSVAFDSVFSEKPQASRKLHLAGWALLVLAIVLLGWQTRRVCRVWHDSVSLWSSVLSEDPRNATAYLNRGEALAGSDLLDKALADFENAKQFDPKNPNIYNNIGIVYFKREQFDKALFEYNSALSLNPLYYNGYYNRGTLWGRLGEYEKAIRDYTSALKLKEDSYLAYYYRGVAYKKLNLIDRAIEDFKAAQSITPTDQVRSQLKLMDSYKTQHR